MDNSSIKLVINSSVIIEEETSSGIGGAGGTRSALKDKGNRNNTTPVGQQVSQQPMEVLLTYCTPDENNALLANRRVRICLGNSCWRAVGQQSRVRVYWATAIGIL